MNPLILTVSQLNTYAKNLLEQDPHLSSVYVTGEISNFTNHYRSGHWYMSLKDQQAVISAVMFRSSVANIRFMPTDGMKVICRGRVSLYDRDGRFQLYIEDMQPDGLGALNLAYEQCKEKLEKMGLFDPSHKKPIPAFPEKIAVVTSPTGAAVQDIMNILSRRYPLATVLMCPVQVQGEAAVPQLVDAIRRLSNRTDVDTVIIGRGGGSLEDLWAFNSEELAMAIYDCPIPVISAVGHETDFTISDFVADLRAPTPSAAAELATPDIADLQSGVNRYSALLKHHLLRTLAGEEERLNRLVGSPKLTNPVTMIAPYEQQLDQLDHRLQMVWRHGLERFTAVWETLSQRLSGYSPLGVLKRGYAIGKKEGQVVRSVAQLAPGDQVEFTVSDGLAVCQVQSVCETGEE